MPHSLAINSQCWPMLSNVRGSLTDGGTGANSFGLSPLKTPSFACRLFALPSFTKRRENFLLKTIGTSLTVSVPAAIAESICPDAIFALAINAACKLVPHACCMVSAGVLGDKPDDKTASRVKFQSLECVMTAPAFTSPNSTPFKSY